MCGITGIVAFNAEGEKKLSFLEDATNTLLHRGPDGQGLYRHQRVGLGHRRLSIIDTSENASQPFSDESGRYTVVFNGEIFNYKELKRQLQQKGIHFRSESDTEVLLKLFIHSKENFLQQLNGEFAFAIYDKESNEILLARDRFGIKPLHYYYDEHLFVFGSELKSLHPYRIPKTIDRASLELYLHLNYIPGPHTIFEGIKKLEAGHTLLIHSSGKVEKRAYYDFDKETENEIASDYETARKKVRELLESSVQLRMVADVPLGTFLSGGIDSSIITAIAAKDHPNLNSFSVGFKDEPLFDETRFAEILAKKYRTQHHSILLSNSDLLENVFSVLEMMDEPFADSSALAVNILSLHTRKKVKVALSGDGADELFAGYNKHGAEMEVERGGIKAQIAKLVHPVSPFFPKSRNSSLGNLFRKIEKFGNGMRLSPAERYWLWAGFEHSKGSLLVDLSNETLLRKEALLRRLNGSMNSVLNTDIHLVLENDMLVKADRMSMSRSLEVRVPFLDHRLAEYTMSLPAGYKIDSRNRKKILVDSCRDLLPEELLNRKKQGFEVPLLKWFQHELKSLITDDLLKDEFIVEQGLFDPEKIKALKQQLFSYDPNDAAARVWALIVFQYWWRKHGK